MGELWLTRTISRRRLLAGTVAIGGLAVACGQPAATPTPVPSTPSAAVVTQTSVTPSSTRGGIAISGPIDGEAKSLQGAGATFPQVLYTKWFTEYEKITGVRVNYQGIGSGGGIKAITDGTVDFGASDGPMTDAQLEAVGAPILHIPTTIGVVVPTYNVPGSADGLKFTGETLAGIYLGEIAFWNDPKLVADNPGLQDAKKEIVVVHRSDGSGTSYVWTDYLSAVSASWRDNVGAATSVDWPTGLGAQGNPGVAGEIKQNPYSIGYVELVYAVQNKLGIGQVKNRAGNFIAPSLSSTTAAAANANIPPDLRASIVDATGAQSYPIASFTWILARERMADWSKALTLTRLLWWGVHTGQQIAGDLYYAPLPESIVARCEAKIREITVNGKTAFPEK